VRETEWDGGYWPDLLQALRLRPLRGSACRLTLASGAITVAAMFAVSLPTGLLRNGLLTALLGAVALVACKPGLANYPDRSKVRAAQKKWCAAMAKHEVEEGKSWLHLADCKGAFPSASAEFLARMTSCYIKQHTELSEVPDMGTLVHNCSEEVLARSEPGDVSNTSLVIARCDRMKRCEQVSVADCKRGFSTLDGMQRTLLTSMYNLGAQARIASCLADADCTKDEDAARAACYQKDYEARVWLPLSLSHDPSLAPKPSD